MYPFGAKLGVWNSRKTPLVVYVEPWANDYTLLPGDELDIIAFGDDSNPSFVAVEWEDASQIYCNDTIDFKVVQGNVELKCGHNRQA